MSARQAALVLHAMCDTDQQWTLSRLSPTRRRVVEPLLAELNALGIPRDRSVLERVTGASAQRLERATPSLDASHPGDLEWLARQPAATVIQGLRDEPVPVVEKLLACRPWPWSRAVASAFGLHAPAVVDCPMLADALGHALAERIRGAGAFAPSNAGLSQPSDAPRDAAEPNGSRSWFTRWSALKNKAVAQDSAGPPEVFMPPSGNGSGSVEARGRS